MRPRWQALAALGLLAASTAGPNAKAEGRAEVKAEAKTEGKAEAESTTESAAESAARVQAWLTALTGPEQTARERAAATLDEGVESGSLPALSAALDDLTKHADPAGMAAALPRMRPRSGDPSPDLLEGLVRDPHPADRGWRDLVSVIGLSHRLARIGTTPAVRRLIDVYGAFGEPVRRDIDHWMVKLGDRAVPALIDARKSDQRSVRWWAGKTLESLGKDVPGEAVQTGDNQVLVDVLLTYGRTKDLDAARAVVSFANNERAQIRDAARQAIRLYAETDVAPLREAYENLTRRKPEEIWTWDQLASALFAELDRVRLSDLYERMDAGLARKKAGDLAGMATLFDQILAREPDFERRNEMTEGYLAFAQSIRGADRGRAAALVRKASRLGAPPPLSRRVEAERIYLETLEEADRGGVVEESTLEKAAALDPSNEGVRMTLRAQRDESAKRMGAFRRAVFMVMAGVAAIFGSAVLLLRRVRSHARSTRGA